ncbi:MAG: hypothetical protein AAF267_21395 [Deinococcota bacterium]
MSDELVFTANQQGKINLDQELERRNIFSVAGTSYYFMLCFEADSYRPVTNRLDDVSPGDRIDISLPLNTNATLTCNEIPGRFETRDEDISTRVREDLGVDIRGRASFQFFVEWLR